MVFGIDPDFRRIEGLEERAQGDAALDAGKGHARALVDARREGEVPVGRTVDVQGFRVCEDARVAVGGADAQRDLVTRPEVAPADGDGGR